MINIAPGFGRAAVMSFSSEANLRISFNECTSMECFAAELDSLHHGRGGTDIPSALNFALQQIFELSDQHQMGTKSKRFAVLITDGADSPGRPTLDSEYDEISRKFNENDITIITVGIGEVDEKHLIVLSGEEDFFHPDAFHNLTERFSKDIANEICEGMNLSFSLGLFNHGLF